MKNSKVMIALAGLLTFSIVVVTAQEKQPETRNMPNDTIQDVSLAKNDSTADYKKFTEAAELQISDNQATIVNLRARKEEPSEAASQAFTEKVQALERDNDNMKKRIAAADVVKTNSWTLFKSNFSRDMSELDHALRDI